MSRDDHKHEHEHDCHCDNEHSCEHNHVHGDEEPETVILLDDEGNEHTFSIVDIVEVDGQSYAVLAPEDDEDGEEGEAYIFRIESENGEDQLVTVDDEEEFERVAAALAELDDWEELDDDNEDDNEEEDD